MSSVLIILPFLASYAAAADYEWTGNTDSDFSNESNWGEPGSVPDWGDTLIINKDSSADGGTPTLTLSDDSSGVMPNGNLVIGQGADANGALDIKAEDGTSQKIHLQNLSVGTDGGTGILTIYQRTDSDPNPHAHANTVMVQGGAWDDEPGLLIGSGTNSNGTVKILGSGKSTAQQNDGQAELQAYNLMIGVDGGTGSLIIDGGSVDIGRGSHNYNKNHFTLGSGTDSNGTVSILSGGKLAVDAYSNPAGTPVVENNATIGLDGGTGTLIISGQSAKGDISRALFGSGLTVAKGEGSQGFVVVDNGASLTTATVAEYDTTDDIPVQVGVDKGVGKVLISGQNSIWKVAGQTYTNQGLGETGALYLGKNGGNGELTINNGGTVSIGQLEIGYMHNEETGDYYNGQIQFIDGVGSLYLADTADSTGTLNIGASEGHGPQAVGTLKADKIVFGAGDGALVFNHTDISGNYAFDVHLESSATGQGTIKNVNGVTVLNTDQTDFTGKSLISGGTLEVNGILGGTTEVYGTGTLAGTGTIGSTTVGNGGTIAPGTYKSSIPSNLTIDGDLTMLPGSIYSVNLSTDGVNPYVADLITVNGDAYLNGGTIKPIAGGTLTLYTAGTRWKILTATGGVHGQFSDLAKLAFVNLTHEYDPNNVYLVVTRNSTGFCAPGMSANQCAVGDNIEKIGSGEIYDLIASQETLEGARKVFDSLSGEVHASVKATTLEDSRFLREAINNRMLDQEVGRGAWVHTFGSWGTFNGNDNTAQIKRTIGGLLVGADTELNEHWQAGLVTGYSKADIDSDERNSNAKREDLNLGAYAQGKWGNASVRTGVGFSWHDYSSKRELDVFGKDSRLTADYNANTTQLFAEGSYQFLAAKTTILEPFVNASYVRLHTEGFTEKGDGMVGMVKLSSGSDNTDMVFSTVGARVKQPFELANGVKGKVWGMTGWRHAYNDSNPTASLNFQGQSSFMVNGTPMTKDALALEFGVEANITPAVSAGVMYNGQIGSGVADHGAKAYVRWLF